jgi:hypothetical protein
VVGATKNANATALVAAGIEQVGFSIPQFCARWSISEAFYRKLRAQKLGPDETHLLTRVIITIESEKNGRRSAAVKL